ncbi:MAG: hypothetical protein PHC34_07065 [Candidatus Gastranaerophilales bacterium]|nr:hypothetical protein [Candidatus Gastranaerophilales bacterium]
MSKKQLYYSDAERMYIVNQMTIEEIASRANSNERTIRRWKEEGDWDTKKTQYLLSKQMFHEELYEFARKLMNRIKEDLENGEKVDTGRMYAFIRMLPMILKVKEYEDISTKKEAQDDKKGLSQDVVALIEQEVLGLNRGQ